VKLCGEGGLQGLEDGAEGRRVDRLIVDASGREGGREGGKKGGSEHGGYPSLFILETNQTNVFLLPRQPLTLPSLPPSLPRSPRLHGPQPHDHRRQGGCSLLAQRNHSPSLLPSLPSLSSLLPPSRRLHGTQPNDGRQGRGSFSFERGVQVP